MLAIAFHIEGAFDHLWWSAVLKKLERRESAPALYSFIYSYLCDHRIAMENNFGREEKRVSKGCPQGSSLWNLVLDIKLLSISEQITPTIYADDILILIGGKSRSKIESLARNAILTQTILTGVAAISDSPSLSARKKQAILLKRKLPRRPQLKVKGITIQIVTDLKYLGLWINGFKGYKRHIAETASKTKKIFSLHAKEGD